MSDFRNLSILVNLDPFCPFELLQGIVFSLGLGILKKLYIQFCILLFPSHIGGKYFSVSLYVLQKT